MYIDALNLVRRDGVATWSSFPYDEAHCSAIPDAATKQAATAFRIADWRRVNVQDDTEVKTNVAAGFPVLIGIDVDRGFFNLRQHAIYSQFSGVSEGGHAIVVVGYDDAKQAFKVINSWGSVWGDQGFGWIAYKVFGQITREGYVAQDVVVHHEPAPQPPQPQPDPPVPVPVRLPSASLGIPQILHNVPVVAPTGITVPGMRITLPGTLLNGRGKVLQVLARFAFQNGPMLVANPVEGVLRDATGFVAIGTPPVPINTDPVDLSTYSVAIPYYALNFVSTNGQASYALVAKVTVYVDSFIVGEQAAPFGLRW